MSQRLSRTPPFRPSVWSLPRCTRPPRPLGLTHVRLLCEYLPATSARKLSVATRAELERIILDPLSLSLSLSKIPLPSSSSCSSGTLNAYHISHVICAHRIKANLLIEKSLREGERHGRAAGARAILPLPPSLSLSPYPLSMCTQREMHTRALLPLLSL